MRTLRLVALGLMILTLLLVVAPGTVLAAAPPPHGGQPDSGGDILAPRFDLGIWSIIVFVVLLWVLGRYAWGPMLQGLKNRERGIQEAISEAQSARDEAHRLRDQFQGEVSNAHLKVREILDDARRDAERTTQDMVAKAKTEIQTERDRLRREITMARDQALQDIWKQSAQLATLISAKAIRKRLDPEDHRRLVDEALGDLKTAGAAWQREGVASRL